MAAHHRVDHLIAILDYNKFQLDDSTKVICDMEPMADKWKSFRWHVQEIDGHNFVRRQPKRGKNYLAMRAQIEATVKRPGLWPQNER